MEPRLHTALVVSLGIDNARDATAEALAWAWEHWDKVAPMENPAGYVYRVARTKARRWYRRAPRLPEAPTSEMPWVEPELPTALSRLSERQRVVVFLVYAVGWTQAEVAELLGLSHGSVQKHAERGLQRLRSALGGSA